MTATPVELAVDQWRQTLARLGVGGKKGEVIHEAIEQYAWAVERVRQRWRTSREVRDDYEKASKVFREALSPYLLRRDKREERAVQRFGKYSDLPIHAYRRETEISVETSNLSIPWRQAVFAAEALSVLTRQADDPVAKRLRLTLGNGHGVAALLDQIQRDERDDHKQEEYDKEERPATPDNKIDVGFDDKREARAKWWLDAIGRAFTRGGDDSLFEHPAILSTVKAIEKETRKGEKVLVFGRFTRPLRALVDLLNAREMLRRLSDNRPWPRAKVHGDKNGVSDKGEWPAVRAALRQLGSPLDLENIDEMLAGNYAILRNRRRRLRGVLMDKIDRGLKELKPGQRVKSIFAAFKQHEADNASGKREEPRLSVLVGRAMSELLGTFDKEMEEIRSSDYANAFIELINAVSDRDEGDKNNDGVLDATEAIDLWTLLKERLNEEYSRTKGGFARLMYGGTGMASRRMIQLSFNRPNCFPMVLVAQSMVGREGLNLHKSCRIVVMLHPEWNPGVVEQQIGRVDRVGSHWSRALDEAIEAGEQGDRLPRIEVRPVIFRGTYDEFNWKILRKRWDDLRAQLHGVVVPPRFADESEESRTLIAEISKAAPNFSPSRMS